MAIVEDELKVSVTVYTSGIFTSSTGSVHLQPRIMCA